jgi:hypothetical protein
VESHFPPAGQHYNRETDSAAYPSADARTGPAMIGPAADGGTGTGEVATRAALRPTSLPCLISFSLSTFWLVAPASTD